MGHIAIINKNTLIVETVLVVDNSKFLVDGKEVEEKGVDFLKKVVGKTYPDTDFIYRKCSYNARSNKYRGCFPGKGHLWDETNQVFEPPV